MNAKEQNDANYAAEQEKIQEAVADLLQDLSNQDFTRLESLADWLNRKAYAIRSTARAEKFTKNFAAPKN